MSEFEDYRVECRERCLEVLKKFNPLQLVKGRGYISCTDMMLSRRTNGFATNLLYDDIINQFNDSSSIKVGGLANGAILLAKAISDDDLVSAFYVRKVAKGGKLVEGRISATDTVVIVDDVLNTGYSIAKSAKAVEAECGVIPTHAFCIVDTEVGGKEFLKTKGIECRSIFTAREILG